MREDYTPPLHRIRAFPAALPLDQTRLQEQNGRVRKAVADGVVAELFEPAPPQPVKPGELEAIKRAQTPSEHEAFQKRFWRNVMLEERVTLADTLIYRVRAGWRIAREMARLKNICSENELLIEGLPLVPDPWTNGSLYNKPAEFADIKAQKRYMAPLWDVVLLICGNPDDNRVDAQRKPLPLLPPKVSPSYRDESGAVIDDYAPENDTRLMAWIKAATRISEHYAMRFTYAPEGGTEELESGRIGLAGLLDPKVCRIAFPTRTQIMYFEEMLLEETIKELTNGVNEAGAWLKNHYGLREREVRGVLAMAMSELRSRGDHDVEEKRSLLEHRLAGFIQRSKEALDLNNEIKALKTLAVVQGLTRTEPEDANREFLEATNRVAQQSTRDQPTMSVIEVPEKEG